MNITHKFFATCSLIAASAFASTGPVECYGHAYGVLFNTSEAGLQAAIDLCQGAASSAPVDCYNDSYSVFFNTSEAGLRVAIRLCQGAASNAPIACYRDSFGSLFNTSEAGLQAAIRLCASAGSGAGVAGSLANAWNMTLPVTPAAAANRRKELCLRTAKPDERELRGRPEAQERSPGTGARAHVNPHASAAHEPERMLVHHPYDESPGKELPPVSVARELQVEAQLFSRAREVGAVREQDFKGRLR
jgi:hypothetical protein